MRAEGAAAIARVDALWPEGWPPNLLARLRYAAPGLAIRAGLAEAGLQHAARTHAAGKASVAAVRQAIAEYEGVLREIADWARTLPMRSAA